MLIIGDVLVSEELLTEQFICNLDACKGACCWEGDYGAPLNKHDIKQIHKNIDFIKPHLSQSSQKIIENEDWYEMEEDAGTEVTKCHKNGACVFLKSDTVGIARCGIENAWRAGESDFQKPLSCHLYPIRVNRNEIRGFEMWNYDRWDICSAACTLGKKEKMPVFRFLKDAIIRYKGEAFYLELENAYQTHYTDGLKG
jgi:Fe-S-cluster containining protein